MTEKPHWSQELQPNPPYFGEAHLVSRVKLGWEVWHRRILCQKILRQSQRWCNYEPGLVSIVILSCKRPVQLKRLCESLFPFLGSIESDHKREVLLVDNGSGRELISYVHSLKGFDRIIAHPVNVGMTIALREAFPQCRGEYILLLEDDFVLKEDKPFLARCLEIFAGYPEIGIIRLKNQNNWWKPYRRIGPLRRTTSGTEFWTWLPSPDGSLNVWAAGSVLFRKISYFSTGELPIGPNRSRDELEHQGYLYECVYGRRYNHTWLAAKIKDCYPFAQPNDHPDSPGWGEQHQHIAHSKWLIPI